MSVVEMLACEGFGCLGYRDIAERVALSPGNVVKASCYGFKTSASGAQNAEYLKKAIRRSQLTGWPVLIDNARAEYRIEGDVYIGSSNTGLIATRHALLYFSDGGLVVSAPEDGGELHENIGLANLTVNRRGVPGPAILVKSTSKNLNVRTTWANVRSTRSTGDGLVFRGGVMHTIHGLWIKRSAGAGLKFEHNSGPDIFSAAGNAVSIYGGEVQNCGWGVDAQDTKSVVLNGFTVENNYKGGVWLRGDNKAFSMSGGYFESNGEGVDHDGTNDTVCSILIGERGYAGFPNRSCSFSDTHIESGLPSHFHAVYILNGHESIVFRNPHFQDYIDAPIKFAAGEDNTTTGKVYDGVVVQESGAKSGGRMFSHDNDKFSRI